jgi:hypothetical protein
LGLPKDVKTDPFSGKPLMLRRSERGWTIYSVGENLKDDAGWLDHQHDTGAGIDLRPDEDDSAGQKP